MNTYAPDSATPSDPPRLHGWKDIAQYLGRGTRTAQRWEQEHGLPVRRLPAKAGRAESVFAYTAELDAWLETAAAVRAQTPAVPDELDERGGNGETGHAEQPPLGETPDGQPRRSGRQPAARAWRQVALGSAVTLALAITAWYVWGLVAAVPPPPTGAPTSARLEFDTLVALDASGAEVWRHRFPGPFAHPAEPADRRSPTMEITRFEDLDRDGESEALVTAVFGAPHQGESGLYCFNSDGTKRWAYRFEGSARFGPDAYDGPYMPYRFFITPSPEAREPNTVWVASVGARMFPAVLQSLDVRTGRASGAYWSNGYIDIVRSASLGGRHVVLVGASNNESLGASLAVLDAAEITGSAPAADPRYACATCPAGTPIAFVVFPKPARFRTFDAPSGVVRLDVGSNQVVVGVQHAASPDGAAGAVVFYRLSPDLASVSADTANGDLAVSGPLAASFPPPADLAGAALEVRQNIPVLEWKHGAFVPLPPTGSR